MSSRPDASVDVVIFGGGIAGLWLLDSLDAAGYATVLLEAGELGSGQTISSQGIIHGGTKYTFGFALDSAVRELKGIPARWQASLEGGSGPDLRRARVLSRRTYMWLPRQVGGGLLGLFSSLIMRSRVQKLPRSDWPRPLRDSGAAGTVFALDEFVLDMPSLVTALSSMHRERIRKIPDPDSVEFDSEHGRVRVGAVTIAAQRIVFAAGSGNEGLMKRAAIDDVPCQRRPLHQVLVRGMREPIYMHCVGKSTKPLATITSHPSSEGGGYLWYVGGLIAEDGVAETEEMLVTSAQRQLPRLIPGADFSAASWSTLRIDRAEGGASGGRRPGGPIIATRGPYVVAWPTKLALAPRMADRAVATFREQGLRPGEVALGALSALPQPTVARPPWEGVTRWI
jgi:glycine/D-amino acid oxidase-like deaminating enzyme